MIARSLSFLLLSIFCIVNCCSGAQLKVTDVKIKYINETYIDKETYSGKLVPVNSSYNRLQVHWKILKDFPDNVYLKVKIYRTPKDKSNSEKLVKTVTSNFCNPNEPQREYLPNILLELTQGHCVQKGDYDIQDAGQYKIDKLLPDNEIEGYNYRQHLSIHVDDYKIKDFQIFSESTS